METDQIKDGYQKHINLPEDENDDLYEHYAFTVEKGQSPLRIDKYLMNRIENATRNKIQAGAKNGSIFVNNVPVKSNYKVKPFDDIRVLFAHPPYENLLVGEDIPLDVVYEDDTLLVVNKPAGMVVHPGHGNYSGTLINALFTGLIICPITPVTAQDWCIE